MFLCWSDFLPVTDVRCTHLIIFKLDFSHTRTKNDFFVEYDRIALTMQITEYEFQIQKENTRTRYWLELISR